MYCLSLFLPIGGTCLVRLMVLVPVVQSCLGRNSSHALVDCQSLWVWKAFPRAAVAAGCDTFVCARGFFKLVLVSLRDLSLIPDDHRVHWNRTISLQSVPLYARTLTAVAASPWHSVHLCWHSCPLLEHTCSPADSVPGVE